MPYQIAETKWFRKRFSKLPKDIRHRFNKQFLRVRKEPFALGKPLGYRWLRELRCGKHRAYYRIYEDQIIILFIAMSEKKDQQEVIDRINIDLVAGSLALKDKNETYKLTHTNIIKMIDEIEKLKRTKDQLIKKVRSELEYIDKEYRHQTDKNE
jgi:mRNA-degrading endonuclease RelE of RelBE toxin-antitoxin system